jgi:uncharacterized Tic20 family protein
MARRASQPAAKTSTARRSTRKAPAKETPAKLQPLSASEERTWAMFAHMSVLINLVTGSLGPAVALVIFLMYRERSKYVAFQALQATLFQLVWWLGGLVILGMLWAITGLLSIALIGLLCLPIVCVFSLLPIYPLIHGTIGAIRCSAGDDFEYFWIGPWTRQILGMD